MTTYRRTAIRSLSVQWYRSLKEAVLQDLPEIIVLYGPNGSGKSNILRAAQLLLRAAGRPGTLPTSMQEAVSLRFPEADRVLDLRPDDFRHGDLPEIRIALEIELGSKGGSQRSSFRSRHPPSSLRDHNTTRNALTPCPSPEAGEGRFDRRPTNARRPRTGLCRPAPCRPWPRP